MGKMVKGIGFQLDDDGDWGDDEWNDEEESEEFDY